MALNMLRLDAKLGEIWGFRLSFFVWGHFQEIGIAARVLGLKPRHVEKLTDVGENELTDEKEIMRKT